MKIIILAIYLFVCVRVVYSQEEDKDINVISYHAVENSLDGQPMIDMQNKLRFFPAFSLRDQTESVFIIVHTGTSEKPPRREAVKSEDGSYWEVQLPKFKLGEAIIKLDVETKVRIREDLKKRYKELTDKILGMYEMEQSSITNSIKDIKSKQDIRLEEFKQSFETNKKNINELFNKDSALYISNKTVFDSVNSIFSEIQSLTKNEYKIDSLKLLTLNSKLESLKTKIDFLKTENPEVKNDISILVNQLSETITTYQKKDAAELTNEVKSMFKEQIENALINLDAYKDTVRNKFIENITSRLTNEKEGGISLTRADLVFDDNMEYVKILYRNYKPGLRQLPALDPAEKLGIFRVRYIPFAVTNNTITNPFSEKKTGVFEIGLGFGDVAVPGDEFFKPVLSFNRLGIAFAITEKLFSDDALIRALAITYEFNLYGSIGIGANFVKENNKDIVKSYYSFGINQKAFEFLISNIQKIFR